MITGSCNFNHSVYVFILSCTGSLLLCVSLAVASRGYSPGAVHGLLIVVGSLTAGHGL